MLLETALWPDVRVTEQLTAIAIVSVAEVTGVASMGKVTRRSHAMLGIEPKPLSS